MDARLRLPRDERHRLSRAVADRLRIVLGSASGHVVGAYWAIRGEPDLRGVLAELVSKATQVALPAVVAKGRPLEFWNWHPGAKMSRGIWNIPVPAERNPVRPSLLLVPLVGFDTRGYRLGYGGGYYDRTLAALKPRPPTIGVGFSLGELSTIHPQPHEIAMDAIATDDEFLWHRDGSDNPTARLLPVESEGMHDA